MTQRILLAFFLTLTALPLPAQKKLLHHLLHDRRDLFAEVLAHPHQYDVQIIYTQIDRDENNLPHFNSFTYQLDEKQYFYPASTVKLPTAIVALEKIKRLKIKHLDFNSTMKTGAATSPQTPAETDSTAINGLPSAAHYAKKVFIVSDNDAHNRFYEFVGQADLNETLWEKGYPNVRLVHRLSVSGFDEESNRHTNPVSFFDGEKLLYHQGEVYSAAPPRNFHLTETLRGKGYYDDTTLVEKPFDFFSKNYCSLQTLHDVLQAVILPEGVSPARRFDLSEADYQWLYQVMSELPRESQHPDYSHEPDHYCKFFLFGDQQPEERMSPEIRIFNKVGWAYGFLTDIAYIVDYQRGIEFFLAATIHVNADGIFNDDQYEYEKIGLPFLANLGRVVYEHEQKRKRKRLPDLSKFKGLKYD